MPLKNDYYSYGPPGQEPEVTTIVTRLGQKEPSVLLYTIPVTIA